MTTTTRHLSLLWLACCAGLIGCGELKDELPAPVSPDAQIHEQGWSDTAAANFHGTVLKQAGYSSASCVPCHGGSLQGGTSGVACSDCHASFPHPAGWIAPGTAQSHGAYLKTRSWNVAECASCHGSAFAGGTSGVSCYTCHSSFPHSAGWNTPPAGDFHGEFIAAAGWDMRSCRTCHGEDYTGGSSELSCRTCHNGPAGPENCTTCHGGVNNAPPRDLDGGTARSLRGVGAHQVHLLGTPRAGAVWCAECHTVPSVTYVGGHVDSPRPAEVLFAQALTRTVTNEPGTEDHDPSLPLTIPSPVYDPAAGTCANTYCHGNFKNGNTAFHPVWNDTTGTQAACGTCHGDVTRPTLAERALPKTSAEGGTHPAVTACSSCHGDVVDANLRFRNAALHVNGKLNVFGSERDY